MGNENPEAMSNTLGNAGLKEKTDHLFRALQHILDLYVLRVITAQTRTGYGRSTLAISFVSRGPSCLEEGPARDIEALSRS